MSIDAGAQNGRGSCSALRRKMTVLRRAWVAPAKAALAPPDERPHEDDTSSILMHTPGRSVRQDVPQAVGAAW